MNGNDLDDSVFDDLYIFKKPSAEKDWVIIFVDHANMFYNLKELNVRIDYEKFKELLTRDRHLVAAVIYMGLMSRLTPKKIGFLEYLRSAGFIILSRPVRRTPNGRDYQKGIDTYIYSDILELTLGDHCDVAILVSGDEDFRSIIPR
ncbi:unnamed protein product [marine sediment metagenome]|uniref:NYN domain-containing protein n=1 Tax=marine sediment metagenome TaxID=412755 RepID=X1CC19_9ZZZZ